MPAANDRSETFDVEPMTTVGREPIGTRPLTDGDKRVIEWAKKNGVEFVRRERST